MKDNIPPRGELTAAVLRDDVQAVADLLARGADVEDMDAEGNTALMSAVLRKQEAVRLLVEYGADSHRENNRGFNAWDLLKDEVDMNWQWPMTYSQICIQRILSEAPESRQRFLEKQAEEAAAKALLERRRRLQDLAPQVVIRRSPKP